MVVRVTDMHYTKCEVAAAGRAQLQWLVICLIPVVGRTLDIRRTGDVLFILLIYVTAYLQLTFVFTHTVHEKYD